MLRALVGPTASGKTDAGIALATRLGADIASVDSMLVYRGMDVGTAKPTAEQQHALPHHLMDLAEPSERYTVAKYQRVQQKATLDKVEELRKAAKVEFDPKFFPGANAKPPAKNP